MSGYTFMFFVNIQSSEHIGLLDIACFFELNFLNHLHLLFKLQLPGYLKFQVIFKQVLIRITDLFLISLLRVFTGDDTLAAHHTT